MVRGFVFIVLECSVVGSGVELKPAGFIRDYVCFLFRAPAGKWPVEMSVQYFG